MKTFAALLACFATVLVGRAQPLQLTRTIPLPGVSGRFDHFSVDVKNERLFVAALGHDSLEVIDGRNFRRIRSLGGLHKPTGVLYLAEPGRLYVANGNDASLRVFDGTTLEPVSRLSSLDDADNVRFDATTQRIYVGFGEGALGITDRSAARLLGRIELKAHPESFQMERNGPRVFVNVPDAKAIAVVDREKQVIVARWPMERYQANYPLALDEAGHRLFVGCRRPARLVILETLDGKPVADVEISGDTDDLFFDAQRQRLYVSCGEGFIDVIQHREGDRFERLERVATRAGARTSFFSPELDRLYLAVPQRDGHEAELRIYQPGP